jgi:DNA-binding CsgD family transcriptional regulator
MRGSKGKKNNMYTLTAKPEIVIRNSDGASIPTNDPSNKQCSEYLAWIAAGNTPAPYVPPALTPRELREQALLADADRADMVDKLKNASPAQIKTYITNNVTNLTQARDMLIKLALAIALIVRQ